MLLQPAVEAASERAGSSAATVACRAAPSTTAPRRLAQGPTGSSGAHQTDTPCSFPQHRLRCTCPGAATSRGEWWLVIPCKGRSKLLFSLGLWRHEVRCPSHLLAAAVRRHPCCNSAVHALGVVVAAVLAQWISARHAGSAVAAEGFAALEAVAQRQMLRMPVNGPANELFGNDRMPGVFTASLQLQTVHMQVCWPADDNAHTANGRRSILFILDCTHQTAGSLASHEVQPSGHCDKESRQQ